MLEEMEEDYSGFFQGVKEVLKARGKKLQGIEGAVAELVTVPKEYEKRLKLHLAVPFSILLWIQSKMPGLPSNF